MAKIVNPVLFSDYFNINLEQFESLGVFNPTLNVDTKLFIDPLLIENSSIDLINTNASNRLTAYFEDIITILKTSEYHVNSAVGLGVSRQEILETTAVAVALCGSVADWPARYVFKTLEDIENDEKEMK